MSGTDPAKALMNDLNAMLNITPEEAKKQAEGNDPTPEPINTDEVDDGEEKDPPADPPVPAKQDEIAELKTQIAQLTNLITNGDKAKSGNDKGQPAPEPQALISQEEFAVAITDVNKFNEVLNRVYDRARQDAIRDVPAVVEATARRQAEYTTASNRFYQDNPDLAEYPAAVAMVANQVAAEQPDLDVQGVLNETAKRAREVLKIGAQAQKREEERESPAFPAPKGSSTRSGRSADTRSAQQKELDAMLGIK
jgi:hypothetical protein